LVSAPTQSLYQTDDIATLRARIAEAVSQQDWSRAENSLHFLLEIVPDDTQAHYQLGLILISQDFSAAHTHLWQASVDEAYAATVTQLLEIISPIPLSPTATHFRQIGIVLVEATEWAYAEKAFNAAIQLNPTDWQSFAYRGYARDQRGANGRESIEIAIALAPTEPLPFFFYGLHFRDQRGNTEDAINLLTRAFFLDSTDPGIAAEIAATYQLDRRYIDAADWYDIAVSLSSNDIRWQRLRAAFYADAEYLVEEAGLSYIREAYTRAPRDPNILTSMGRAYFLIEEYEESHEFLQRALEITPDNPRTLYYWGDQLRAEGDREGAIETYSLIIKIAGSESGFGFLAGRLLEAIGEPLP
jgi:tetratricopeptide (TPR) repeat protein